jgi:hypothetical protein
MLALDAGAASRQTEVGVCRRDHRERSRVSRVGDPDLVHRTSRVEGADHADHGRRRGVDLGVCLALLLGVGAHQGATRPAVHRLPTGTGRQGLQPTKLRRGFDRASSTGCDGRPDSGRGDRDGLGRVPDRVALDGLAFRIDADDPPVHRARRPERVPAEGKSVRSESPRTVCIPSCGPGSIRQTWPASGSAAQTQPAPIAMPPSDGVATGMRRMTRAFLTSTRVTTPLPAVAHTEPSPAARSTASSPSRTVWVTRSN